MKSIYGSYQGGNPDSALNGWTQKANYADGFFAAYGGDGSDSLYTQTTVATGTHNRKESMLLGVFTSQPFDAQVISGGFSGVVKCAFSALGAAPQLQVLTKAVLEDGSVVLLHSGRHPIFAYGTGPLSTAKFSGQYGVTTLSAFTLVSEVGFQYDSVSGAKFTGRMEFGDSLVGSLPFGNAATTTGHNWLEQPQDWAVV